MRIITEPKSDHIKRPGRKINYCDILQTLMINSFRAMSFIPVGFGSLNDSDSPFGYLLSLSFKVHTPPAYSRRTFICALFQYDMLIIVLFDMYFRKHLLNFHTSAYTAETSNAVTDK
uniref:G_PROTEIN_RECEP_F1_2 domain-containing protein n=1 Tax=Ascaris lumbricoides TaxID=6252 RepID=A0A0M3IKE3_ASCLU